MRRARALRARRGVTLIELIVAIVLSGIVAVAAYGGVGVAVDASARLRRDREAMLASVGARAALVGWLRAMVPALGSGASLGVDRRAGDVPDDELTFLVSDGGPLWPGPHQVRLWIARDPRAAHRGLLAELTQVGVLVPRVDTLDVAPSAVGLSLRYRLMDHGREQWRDWWQSDTLVVLRAVELRVLPSPGSTALPPLLTVPVLVPVGHEGS